MTYVVTENCIHCKYQDCVDVCPVDAFREGVAMLVIAPDACIDCGVCESECPAAAILPDSLVEPRWVELNAKYSRDWPLIRSRGRPFAEADTYAGVDGKYARFFSEEPGAGG